VLDVRTKMRPRRRDLLVRRRLHHGWDVRPAVRRGRVRALSGRHDVPAQGRLLRRNSVRRARRHGLPLNCRAAARILGQASFLGQSRRDPQRRPAALRRRRRVRVSGSLKAYLGAEPLSGASGGRDKSRKCRKPTPTDLHSALAHQNQTRSSHVNSAEEPTPIFQSFHKHLAKLLTFRLPLKRFHFVSTRHHSII
jgi:hypothetical protein